MISQSISLLNQEHCEMSNSTSRWLNHSNGIGQRFQITIINVGSLGIIMIKVLENNDKICRL